MRPSYWVEPSDDWGEGRIELVEIPTGDETNDNIVAYWTPQDGARTRANARLALPNQGRDEGLRPASRRSGREYMAGGAARSGLDRAALAHTRRFIIDFSGGELPYFLGDPDKVQIVPSVSNGRIVRTWLTPNPKTNGFRAAVDVALEKGQSADIRAFLKAGNRALTETWTFPWKAE